MDCTDIIIGSANGQLSRVGDYYTRDRSTPKRDVELGQTESLTAAIGFEENGETTILFRRKLVATERTDHTIADALMHVIWAKGQDETNYIHRPASGDQPGFYKQDHLLYHGHSPQRGVQTINFLEKPAKSSSCNGRWPLTCNACNLEATWVFDAATDSIKFTLKARLNGQKKWIALGFSADMSMPDSDAVVGWIDNGRVNVTDRWMTARSLPAQDTKNDITDVSGDVTNGVTTISFTRKRDTGDTQDFQFTDTQCGYMFYAMGGSYSNGGTFSRHALTPVVSASKICIRSCAIQSTTPSTIPEPTGEPSSEPEPETTDKPKPDDVPVEVPMFAEVRMTQEFRPAYLDKNSNEYKTLAKVMTDWMIGNFKNNSDFKSATVTGFRPGSIITSFNLIFEKEEKNPQTQNMIRDDIISTLKKAESPDGYTIDKSYIVVNPPTQEEEEEPGFKLSLVEEIVIGCAVALVSVCIIVAICKVTSQQRTSESRSLESLNQRVDMYTEEELEKHRREMASFDSYDTKTNGQYFYDNPTYTKKEIP